MKYVMIIGFLLGVLGMAACDLLNKKNVAHAKKYHFETVIGNTPVSCKSAVARDGITLQECIAIVGGIPMRLPDVMGAANVMKFEDNEEQQ